MLLQVKKHPFWIIQIISCIKFVLNVIYKVYVNKQSKKKPLVCEEICKYEELVSKTSYIHSHLQLSSQQRSQFSTQNLLQMENGDTYSNLE